MEVSTVFTLKMWGIPNANPSKQTKSTKISWCFMWRSIQSPNPSFKDVIMTSTVENWNAAKKNLNWVIMIIHLIYGVPGCQCPAGSTWRKTLLTTIAGQAFLPGHVGKRQRPIRAHLQWRRPQFSLAPKPSCPWWRRRKCRKSGMWRRPRRPRWTYLVKWDRERGCTS